MFKIESYITPIILNYVGKFVKNFKPEQSQVSLWGGDATFQNLDLKLSVLNDELKLPFKFISGHIHELSIHVPWVKIASEPIVVTINTIECILKMRDDSEVNSDNNFPQKINFDTLQEETPSSYIKTIVTKVVNNITINCNNLILKFVEEDIVLSVNIRFFGLQTVNNEWKPSFTDIYTTDMILRKLITIEDLTLCLDRMDASGKIEIYQDPVVYRCSMTIRWLIDYQKQKPDSTERESVTRFDVHCKKIEFSMTEHQLPMIMRLVTLIINSLQSELNSRDRMSVRSSEGNDQISVSSDDNLFPGSSNTSVIARPTNNISWSSWAWQTVTSLVPDWNNDLSLNKSLDNNIQVINFGIYVDETVFTFKVIEVSQEVYSRKNLKVKYRPCISLRLSAVSTSVLVYDINFTAVQIKLGYIGLYPQGNCTCGFSEVKNNLEPTFYLTAGSFQSDYNQSSLFDINANENNGLAKNYKEIMSKTLLSKLFTNNSDKSPALMMDFVHFIEIPAEMSKKELFRFNGNFEFCNFKETKITRYYVGNLTVKICSGIIHRLSAIADLVEKDFLACFSDKNNDTLIESSSTTIEEFDALNEYIATEKVELVVNQLTVEIFLANHHHDIRKSNLDSNSKNYKFSLDYPRLAFEIDRVELSTVSPIYPLRVVLCACKQIKVPKEMLDSCYKTYELNICNLKCKLHLAENNHMIFLSPFGCKLSAKSLIYPQYWSEYSDVIQASTDLFIDNLTITTTKVKFLIIYTILTSIFLKINTNITMFLSLFHEACNETNQVYLELTLERINYFNSQFLMFVLTKINVGSIKIFVLNDITQAFIMSGPESLSEKNTSHLFYLFTQLPRYWDNEVDNLIIKFHFNKTRVILDPLLFDWLDYNLNFNDKNNSLILLDNYGVDETSSDTSTRKKFPSLHENVHSLSEGECRFNAFNWIKDNYKNDNQKEMTPNNYKIQSSLFTRVILDYYSKWRRLIFNITIDNCTIYQPTLTINCLGVDGIEEAKERALNSNEALKLFVINTSKLNVQSASWNDSYHSEMTSCNILRINDVKLKNFPWTLDLTRFHCFTLINKKVNNFLSIDYFNTTIDSTLKSNVNENHDSSSSLGFCIYINTSPILFSLTNKQLELIDDLLNRNCKIVDKLFTTPCNTNNQSNLKFYNDNFNCSVKNPLSPTQIFFMETDTMSTSASTSKNDVELESINGDSVTAWIQWTITKMIIELLTDDDVESSIEDYNYKVIVEFEDIITSLDWQPIYVKLKNKITSAKIMHYRKLLNEDDSNWMLGDFTGFIMSSKSENLDKKLNEVDFLSFTLTIAKSNNVYHKWMRFKNKFSKNCLFNEDNAFAMSNYVTEIVIEVQMLEIILPINLIQKFKVFLNFRFTKQNSRSSAENFHHKFPLVYLDLKGVTLIIPIDLPSNQRYDTFILTNDGISIIPHADNPICRMILRPDIYELAAQSNILNTPSSILEDRQYQIKVNGISISSTNWINYHVKATERKTPLLFTMNENPALEWNKLENILIDNKSTVCPLINRFDLCCIIAPSMILKSKIIVCGNAIEITCLTDIKMVINLDQIKLFSIFCSKLEQLEIKVNKTSDKCNVNSYYCPTTLPTVQETRNESIQESYRESIQDSGVDVGSSSIDGKIYVNTRDPETTEPYENVINCGKLSIAIYKNADEDPDKSNFKIPLAFIAIYQPNVYISQNNRSRVVRINCFDISVLFSEKDTKIMALPDADCYKNVLVQTKSGDPHPITGIPPSIFVVKWENNSGYCKISAEVGRPTKINVSSALIDQINNLNNEFTRAFDWKKEEKSKSSSFLNDYLMIKNISDIIDVNLTTKQIVVAVMIDYAREIIGNLSELSITLLSKIRKIQASVELNSFVITTNTKGCLKALLNPLSCNFVAKIILESWQDLDESPLIRFQGYSDSINIDLGPEQVKFIEKISSEFQNYLKEYTHEKSDEEEVTQISSTEQYYQDDLRAGAFQFADGTNDQVPLPYQVIFSNYPRKIMAWKYPQPRILTRLNLTNILWNIINDLDIDLDQINCIIEYWNDNLMSYQRFIQFNMSESDNLTSLLNKSPSRAVSCLWRATICSNDEAINSMTPRDLAGCLRIDSYFNSSYIPSIEVTLNINYIKISLFNNFYNHNYNILPFPLDKFKLNNFVPLNQCFADFIVENNCFVYNKWVNDGVISNFIGNLSVKIIDYESMMMHKVLESLELKAQLNKLNPTKFSLTISEMTLRLGPEIAHTLILSLDQWNSTLKNDESCKNCSIFNRIILANDCNLPIRFSQDKTTDDIILQTRECYFYSWRQKSNLKLRVAIKIDQTWVWSDLFKINNNSNYNVIEINVNSKDKVKIHYKIKFITSTQKIIFFTGQLIVKNELTDDFELKLVQYNTTADKTLKSESTFTLLRNHQPQSFLINDISNVTMRLRFMNLTSSTSWTGDIPLKANPKCDQPWLVKLPFNNKNQFLSIWVRNIRENLLNDIKILVILSPLYLIQSWLPNSVDINIETPTLNSSISSVLSGRGERQQIHCPGTFEHHHLLKLMFSEDVNTNLNFPISYNSVDQRNFFKRPENEKIDDILNQLSDNKSVKKNFWPVDENYTWVSVVKSQTYVQINYKDAGLISSTLLVEIRPWCFILNAYSKNINLVSPEIYFMCTIPSNSVTSPPKILEIFHIGVELFNDKFMSPPLQFANSESNRGFIKPQINGLIPLEGNIETFIDCGSVTINLIINSHVIDNTRVIKIMSSHVVCNLTSHSLKLASMYVEKNCSNIDFTTELTGTQLNLPPSKNDGIGLPIESWHNSGIKNYDRNNFNSFISLTLEELNDIHSWSCPIKLDQSFGRNCVSITRGNKAIPIIVMTQKDRDVVYVTIIEDQFPQFTITNSCSFTIMAGHPNPTLDSLELDAPPFNWACNVRPGYSCHYTLKKFGSCIPDSSIDKEIFAQLWLCIPLEQSGGNLKKKVIDKFKNNSVLIKIIEFPVDYPVKFDRFIGLDHNGPIKIIVESWGHSIFINIEPKSNIEVSVRDIRSRLISEKDKLYDSKLPSDSKYSSVKNLQSIENTKCTNSKSEDVESTRSSREKIAVNLNDHSDTVCSLYLHKINIIITQDGDDGVLNEVAALYLTNTFILVTSNIKCLNLKTFIGDLQLDNQLFNNGGYDFPVVLINQKPAAVNKNMVDLSVSPESTVFELKNESLITFELSLDKIYDKNSYKNVYIKVLPTNIYIEDKFISQLLDYLSTIIQPYIFTSSQNLNLITKKSSNDKLLVGVRIPTNVIVDTKIISSPLRLQTLIIEPISILVSVHTSVRLYIALDHSPLHFAIFERRNLFTTPYRLGNALTMHYLSGAIFGAGWVVGSLEILGSPGSFAQAVGLGLKDFISLPFQGLLHGPWGFIMGITHGSASLMKNVTAGTVNSVTKLASSVAKNLDRLTLDNEHLQRQEESRRLKPQGMTQGFYQGLTSFGISILAAVAGLAHHPLQNFLSSDSTTRGIVTGVGLGLVGVVTKPLSGAAELVALTGQGLLQGTGWNPLPLPKRNVKVTTNNSCDLEYRFLWKLMDYIIENHDDILYLINAHLLDTDEKNKPVILILTRKKLIIIDIENDNVQKIFSFNDFHCSDDNMQDSKLFRLIFTTNTNTSKSKNHFYSDEQREINDEMRSRVEQYVLTGGFHNYYSATGNNTVVTSDSNCCNDNSLLFIIDFHKKNYLISIIKLIKRQSLQKDFTVI
ncbi:intermembrane lipid transfer protein VPS13B [Microplitis demolitor]|uniref:intermembrane lipid transfer protein VPS13B n=1 Tax=Microplitis demolitor TaxID=69319 RepID=UPI00043FFD90|nr:intermembrane lipid transfer protein VPS13B [Microplitis demolitor]